MLLKNNFIKELLKNKMNLEKKKLWETKLMIKK